MADEALDTLAPYTSTKTPEFVERFHIYGSLLSHSAANAYIKRQIERVITVKGEAGLVKEDIEVDGMRLLVIPIYGLLKKTGQLAHVGLGRVYGRPVVYIDKEVYASPEDRSYILRHEAGEVRGWEAVRDMLGIQTAVEMREWIRLHINSPDERLVDTEYEDMDSRTIAKYIHDGSFPLGYLSAKYADRVRLNLEYLENLVTLYAEDGMQGEGVLYAKDTARDVNIGAGVDDAETEPPAITESSNRDREEDERWISLNAPDLEDKMLVSISMEGNIPEFAGYPAQNANTRGGLGAYFGDKLEGLADIGMRAIGMQPGYSHILREDDHKKIKVNYELLIRKGIMKPVFVGENAIKVRAWDEDPEARIPDEKDPKNPEIAVDVYEINRGGTRDYIFLSKVFDILYPDEKTPDGAAHRFAQEVVFGKTVYELHLRLGLIPDILHLNEAHTVVAAAQMRADKRFDDMAIVYTNHTIVPAGLQMFKPGTLRADVGRMMYVIGIPGHKAEEFRSKFLRPDGTVDFCYAAAQLADIINAVSDEHAIATDGLFKNLYGGDFNKPIIGVLNGSGKTWKSDELLALEGLGRPATEDELWQIHEINKTRAFDEIEKRTGINLDLSKPTAWAVRRLTDYKSQYPMLRFLVHIMTADKEKTFTRDELKELWLTDIPEIRSSQNVNIVESVLDIIFDKGQRQTVNGLGMQVVVGGPEYEKWWVEEFKRWSDEVPALKGRFVYVPNSDAELLKLQAVGADVCINMPRPLEEACGTSDQRAGLNGGVNIAIRGAGPVEWIEDYDEALGRGNGFLVDSYTIPTTCGAMADPTRFYREAPAHIFQKCETAARIFDKDGKAEWKHLMHNAYSRANELVTAEAMEKRYATRVYLQALINRRGPGRLYKTALHGDLKEVDNMISLLDRSIDGSTVHDIRYDEARLREVPYAVEIIRSYVELLRIRFNDPDGKRIKLIPSSLEGSLILIQSYKNQTERARGNLAGEGSINVQGDLKDQQLRLVAMMNMAFAASHIRANIPYGQMDEMETRLIRFIKEECKAITGIDVPDDRILGFIKDMPRSQPIPINDLEEYYRFTYQALQQSA